LWRVDENVDVLLVSVTTKDGEKEWMVEKVSTVENERECAVGSEESQQEAEAAARRGMFGRYMEELKWANAV
jgi:hypothetical protein